MMMDIIIPQHHRRRLPRSTPRRRSRSRRRRTKPIMTTINTIPPPPPPSSPPSRERSAPIHLRSTFNTHSHIPNIRPRHRQSIILLLLLIPISISISIFISFQPNRTPILRSLHTRIRLQRMTAPRAHPQPSTYNTHIFIHAPSVRPCRYKFRFNKRGKSV